jgi:hypothetical protein
MPHVEAIHRIPSLAWSDLERWQFSHGSERKASRFSKQVPQ